MSNTALSLAESWANVKWSSLIGQGVVITFIYTWYRGYRIPTFMVTALMDFQSDTFSPRRTQTDSSATRTKGGGIAIDLEIDFYLDT